MSGHTPGPWTVESEGHVDGSFYIMKHDRVLALVSDRQHPRSKATACLMAAAPELLAAARGALAEMLAGGGADESWNQTCDEIKAAIAKAEGR